MLTNKPFTPSYFVEYKRPNADQMLREAMDKNPDMLIPDEETLQAVEQFKQQYAAVQNVLAMPGQFRVFSESRHKLEQLGRQFLDYTRSEVKEQPYIM